MQTCILYKGGKLVNKNEFAQKIIMLRGALGLTQEEFAEKVNVSKRSVSAWENGELIPKKTVRINIAVMHNIDVNEFLLDEEKSQSVTTPQSLEQDEKYLLNQLKNVIENSNIEKNSKDIYTEALYQIFNMKE